MIVCCCSNLFVRCEFDGALNGTILEKWLFCENFVKDNVKPNPDIVKLNIGGTHFTTFKSTLNKSIQHPDGGYYEPHLLHQLINGGVKMTLDDNNEIFIDRDPKYFPFILDYLRSQRANESSKLFFETDESFKQTVFLTKLSDEALFYNLRGFHMRIVNSMSSIIDPNQFVRLKKLGSFRLDQQWKVLYRGSVDGFGAADFHRKCDGHTDTLTIVKSTNGYVFGGYTKSVWDKSDNYKTEPGAFLFSLINSQKVPYRFNCIQNDYNIRCNPNYGPTFGYGFDLYIATDANSNTNSYAKLGTSYQLPAGYDLSSASSFLAGSKQFQINEIEVFTKIDTYSSYIVSQTDFPKLNSLCGFPTDQKWRLLYRGSVDGFGAADFHNRCNNIPDTLTIVKSTNGYVFGGFTHRTWDSTDYFKLDTGSFIFSFVNAYNKPIVLNCTERDYSIYNNPNFGPVFGKGYDLFISSDSNTNTNSSSNLGRSYQLPYDYTYDTENARSFLAGSHRFQVAEIEVFAKLVQ
jgi:hypothetical protein